MNDASTCLVNGAGIGDGAKVGDGTGVVDSTSNCQGNVRKNCIIYFQSIAWI